MSKTLLSSLAGAVVSLIYSSALPETEKEGHITGINTGLVDLLESAAKDVVTAAEAVAVPVIKTALDGVETVADTAIQTTETVAEAAIDTLAPAALDPIVDPLVKGILDLCGGDIEKSVHYLIMEAQKALPTAV